jgi:hypothetical protein
LDTTTNVICIALQPWAGARRGALVAVSPALAVQLQRRGVLEFVTQSTTAVTPRESPVAPADVETPTDTTRKRGRPPRAK